MTDSDVESDEEFQATLSYFEDDPLNRRRDCGVQLDRFSYKGRLVLDLVTTQIGSGRVDRVESILLLLMRFHEANSVSQELVDDVICHALSQAASMGNVGAIQMICRITAGYDLSFAKQHAAIRILFFQNENPSCVEALRELGFEGFSQVFDLVKEGGARHFFGSCRSTPQSFQALQHDFFLAALDGDLAEVKRILDDQRIDLRSILDVHVRENAGWFSHVRVYICSCSLCTAAARGHWKVVKAILAKFTEAERLETARSLKRRGYLTADFPMLTFHYLYRSVVIIAAQRNDISIFSEKFAGLKNATSDVFFLPYLFRKAQPEFMEKVRLLRYFSPQKHRDMEVSCRYLNCLMDVFLQEIRCHRRPRHVDFLLQEMFEQKIVSVKVLAPFLLDVVFTTKRVSVVKRVLLFKPSFFIDGAYLDLEDYKFDRCSESLRTRGVRLLVEAGVKLLPPVPAEHTELFSLSLQDRCLITVRGCLKLPVRESVQKLPLPPTLKRRLLYRF